MVLIDLKEIKNESGFPLSGEIVSRILDQCGLTCNKNAIFGDENPVHPSAIRLGTTWVTQRGMGKPEMEKIAELVHKVVTNIQSFIYIGGGGEIGRGKIDFDLMEEVKAQVSELEQTLARDEISLDSGYPHYYSIVDEDQNNTVLVKEHEALGAVFEKHRGFNIPVHYGDADSEFLSSNEGAALFDMWDLGILEVSGDFDRVMPFIQEVQTKDISDLAPGMGTWAFILDKNSKPIGDVHILRLSHKKEGQCRYLLVTSGLAIQKIKTWLRALSDGYVIFDDEDFFAKIEGPVIVRDLKEVTEDEQMSALALIGQNTKEILSKLIPDVKSLKPSEFIEGLIEGEDVLIIHELHGDFVGYDIFLKPASIPKIWERILATGKDFNIRAAGFFARQMIRSESGLPVGYDEEDGPSLYKNQSSYFDLKKSYFVGQRQILKTIEQKEGKKIYSYTPEEKPPKKSCLYDEHLKLTKKMAHFAGWEMPLWYTKTSDEHLACRNSAGLFDVSHMGILEFSGEHSTRFLDYVATNYIPWLQPGQSHYSYILDPHGKVMDDIFLYRLDFDRYMMVVNAANMDKIKAWLEAVASKEFFIDNDNIENEIEGSVIIRDLKDESAGSDMKVDISLQGPNSLKILWACSDDSIKKELARLKKLEFIFVRLADIDVMVSRTGYTGEEIGYELYLHPNDAPKLWRMLLEKGKKYEIKPCGLGARDSTRTEAGFPLYGNELASENDIDPVEAGYGSFVRFHKPFFIGRKPLFKRHLKLQRAVIRFNMLSKGIRAIRPDHPVYNLDGEDIGLVTSCVLVEGIQVGMALIDSNYAKEEEHINVSLLSPDKTKDKVERQKGKDYEEAEILPRFMMEIDEGDTPKKI
jgi:glycine cleavage system T protein